MKNKWKCDIKACIKIDTICSVDTIIMKQLFEHKLFIAYI